jgi:mRNA-degrading endonuclease RelE of RelBE toxin-antitoxin system
MAFRIKYSPAAEKHLRFLTARQQANVLDSVPKQLRHEPQVETKKRRLMRPNPLASWELRLGNLRVYYDVHFVPEKMVEILAVGIKDREQVLIGGKEYNFYEKDGH